MESDPRRTRFPAGGAGGEGAWRFFATAGGGGGALGGGGGAFGEPERFGEADFGGGGGLGRPLGGAGRPGGGGRTIVEALAMVRGRVAGSCCSF